MSAIIVNTSESKRHQTTWLLQTFDIKTSAIMITMSAHSYQESNFVSLEHKHGGTCTTFNDHVLKLQRLYWPREIILNLRMCLHVV